MSPSREAISLRPATPEDVPAMIATGDAAFGRFNGVSRTLFPESLTPDPALRWANELAWRTHRVTRGLANPRRHYVVAETPGGRMAGWAGWEEVGKDEAAVGGSTAPEGQRELEEEAKGAPGGESLSWEGMRRIGQMFEGEAERVLGKGGATGMWTLFGISVHPEHQRKGIGRLLLDWGIEQARRDGKDIYLVSMPAGKSLYLGAGFEVIGTVDSDLIGVENYHMILRASRTEAT